MTTRVVGELGVVPNDVVQAGSAVGVDHGSVVRGRGVGPAASARDEGGGRRGLAAKGGRAAQHVDAGKARRPGEGAERFDRRHVPVAEVGVELASGVQLEQAPARVAGTWAATVSITATSPVTAFSRSKHVSGSFMWYSTPRYSTMSKVPNVERSTDVKSATTGSTRLPSTRCASSNPRRPGRSERQKSVVSRDWSGSSPRARQSFQYSERAVKSTPQA